MSESQTTQLQPYRKPRKLGVERYPAQFLRLDRFNTVFIVLPRLLDDETGQPSTLASTSGYVGFSKTDNFT
jgi:hypothetical protein